MFSLIDGVSQAVLSVSDSEGCRVASTNELTFSFFDSFRVL
jgi:hypothetical protein